MIPFSVLDLSPIVVGSDAGQALRNSRDLAQHAERLGYQRYWLAEHHNMPGVASAATAVAIGFVAEGVRTIRLGAGGIMLPNHAPLVIAEQFGTLAALYPGRIDLGVGRAPGTDQLTMRALRRNLAADVDQFPQDVVELLAFLKPAQPGQMIQAVPGAGSNVPVWILGSSTFGAQLAAMLGLPFAFASHFAPAMLEQAVAIYRDRFQPSEHLQTPYVMLGLSVVAGETDEEARWLFTSHQQGMVALRSGRPGPLPPPLDDPSEFLAGPAAAFADAWRHPVVGGPEAVREGLERFIARHRPDELMITGQVFEHARRKRSFEIVAQVRDQLAKAA